MTAEIAILNRTAVALAADSVVTLAGPKSSKTYDSAEKIFQLSRYQPIGLMIYNNALFMNVPLEVVVRRYREKVTTVGFQQVVQVWPDFERFLLEFSRDCADEHEHFDGMMSAELKRFTDMVFTHMVEAIGKDASKSGETAGDFLLRRIAERTEEVQARRLDPPFLDDVSEEQFADEFSEHVQTDVEKRFTPLGIAVTPELKNALVRLMFEVIKSNIRSDAYTGLVFAGLGHEELFPTLYAIELDGIYFGRTRTMSEQLVDIDRRGDTAAVVPFAQKDMVERFVYGIDSSYERALEKVSDGVVSDVVAQVGEELSAEQRELTRAAAERVYKKGMEELKEHSSETLKAVVDHMSKKELGELAFSLVELTSRKRRYSPDLETVGGPIDVAILTRNEGFVWVRRKHYFEADLNPQYTPR